VDQYNVVWNSPSTDAAGSMPIGNGDIGLNVWVEREGDLLFYISKTDAWNENARLLKLGRVRIKLSPNPFRAGLLFRQTLHLRTGEITIRAGAGEEEVNVTIWVDANQAVVRVEAAGRQAFGVTASLEAWRTQRRTLEGQELHSAFGLTNAPFPIVEEADTILEGERDRVVWFHRNTRSIWPDVLRHQGLGSLCDQLADPLLDRTFGAVIVGDGMASTDAHTLETIRPGTRQIVSIYPLTQQTPTVDGWLRALDQQIAAVAKTEIEHARVAHRGWWQDFWNRSWIRVGGSSIGDVITRGYVLQRFMNGCAGRGSNPIKFNGSIFTFDVHYTDANFDEDYDADYRRWGGPYWFQNTRLTYWPMLQAGDFDLMHSFFRMYQDALPLAERRTHLYYGHAGAFFPETMYFWGTYTNRDYGWDRAGKAPGDVENAYIRYYWSGGLELSAMLLDYYAYTQDQAFLETDLLPLVTSIIQFYDEHYKRNAAGKLRFEPSQALETWHEAVNPLPEIAGLQFVLERLLILPPDRVPEEQRTRWQRLRQELPTLPMTIEVGQTVLAPAEELLGKIMNSENVELYAVFPYRLYGVGKPDLEIGRQTFEHRRIKESRGWRQDAIQAAYLGLAEVAGDYTKQNFSTSYSGSRFPAFWGPNFNWIPDQDHGGVAMMALQTMLLQAEGDKLLLLPAWPRHWDVSFKLHAPRNTVVEGEYRGGQLEWVTVTPEERAQDIVIAQP